ncbi:probable very-long-chain enoyl-CoA reductase art-1 [Folsomia candida]|uniref:very-long-chain enoyl-CoA reductase n=1 Tax=Folsomia candida TaxID=158441 RepID=A0A226D9G8_FOLCA|nr:probable very-long-chain enoyl-CoA reductase art-1 [Folsomia candida]OXA41790.1 putative very-long-chain enoyl-CoA reductase art-1 [Folsomia candida]
MEIEICSASGRVITKLPVYASSTVGDVKGKIHQAKKGPYPGRQMLRLEAKGKALDDKSTLADLGIKSGGKLFLKDLGPQIGWITVFLSEYAGPLAIYMWIYTRPWIFYGDKAASKPYAQVVHIAAACWGFHYAKRLLETIFVHRFSHATMPIMNLFKNCGYYWGFAAYVAYHVNHPLYTAPSYDIQVYVGAALFVLSELGNLSIHVALRNLRPPGTTERRIPYPTSNPFTALFKYVSCPNYTYEFYAWLSFTVMTQCLPAGLFTIAGMYQMTVWALGKHRNYKKEFAKYPRGRKSIIPFVI